MPQGLYKSSNHWASPRLHGPPQKMIKNGKDRLNKKKTARAKLANTILAQPVWLVVELPFLNLPANQDSTSHLITEKNTRTTTSTSASASASTSTSTGTSTTTAPTATTATTTITTTPTTTTAATTTTITTITTTTSTTSTSTT